MQKTQVDSGSNSLAAAAAWEAAAPAFTSQAARHLRICTGEHLRIRIGVWPCAKQWHRSHPVVPIQQRTSLPYARYHCPRASWNSYSKQTEMRLSCKGTIPAVKCDCRMRESSGVLEQTEMQASCAAAAVRSAAGPAARGGAGTQYYDSALQHVSTPTNPNPPDTQTGTCEARTPAPTPTCAAGTAQLCWASERVHRNKRRVLVGPGS